ncbi:MFS transporter [Streptomyces sp. CB01881]|uniref:MFS transporter n=1 Tax=Streptomyces sp. CB01881 TaxID=2078691 RepID=UPI000CDBAAB9|nr:MFS transporter [Streptomyces sp. CB01881]AUY52986.1 MFS transporter [Streptomyces sp. CB01881]TYC70701.1 MFS transporter [Streptomyces sp. CB01881]
MSRSERAARAIEVGAEAGERPGAGATGGAEAEAGTAGGGPLARLLPMLTLGHAAMFMVYIGIGGVLLPVQIEQIDPDGKIGSLGLVSGVAAIFATVFNPLAGLLSDRSRRRNPWILGGGLAAFATLALLGAVRTILLVTIAWCLVQATMNVYQAALTAIVPDRVAADRRGLASAMVGIGTPIGSVVGVMLATRFVPDDVDTGYLVLGAVTAVVAVLFTLLVRDERLPAVETVPLRRQVAAFAETLRVADFRWAFTGRFLMMLGFFSVSLFQYYILQDHITLPEGLDPEGAQAVLAPVDAVCTLLATVVGGLLSDRLGRRKPFIAVSCVLSAATMMIPVIQPDWTGMLLFTALAGISFGCFMAVDTALVTLVLPSADDAARDLGVLNIANAGPQIIAPFVASLVVGSLGYNALYVVGALIIALGALSVAPIKSVR